MIELTKGRKKWQNKARTTTDLLCHCWFCLRDRGITPDANSDERHRRSILPGSPVYRTDNGQVTNVAPGSE